MIVFIDEEHIFVRCFYLSVLFYTRMVRTESDLGGLTLPCATCHGLPGEKNNAMNLYGIKEEIFLINSNLFSYDQIKIGV